MLNRSARKYQQPVGKNQPSLVARLRNIYEICKKYIIYTDIVIILAVLYFGSFLGPLQQILYPAAVGSILVILMDTLIRLEASISASSKELISMNELIPIIDEIIAHDKGITILEIIAATGATTINTMFPRIMQSSTSSEVNISLHIVNPKGVCAKWFPPHWDQEVQTTTSRIQHEIRSNGIKLSLYNYEHLPNIHGVMVNKKHLFIGFFGWRNYRGMVQLSGAERPHRYLTRTDAESEYFFDLFEDWTENAPHQLVYQYP